MSSDDPASDLRDGPAAQLAPASASGRSLVAFGAVAIAATVVLVVLATWYSTGSALLVGGAVLVLLLPLGLDTRVAGWLTGYAVVVGLDAIRARHPDASGCRRFSGRAGCDIHLEWGWLAAASLLLVVALAVLITARRRPARDA